jgi:manganese transport protein
MAEANVITGFLGKPEDPRTLLYKISVFVTAIPAFFIIAFSTSTFRLLVFSQAVLSFQLPFTLIPLLILCHSRKVMGGFRSNVLEFILAIIISAIVIVLNIYLLYSTIAEGA